MDTPLAVRMRPRTVDEIVGQDHLLAAGSPLRRLAEGRTAMAVFLWGPPGVGKTTIAAVVSASGQRRFVELSAVTAGVKEVRAALADAKRELARGIGTVLFVDEVHRFSKAQQDVLLPAVENRLVTLIAATTENPSFSVISPLLSRSLLLTLKPLNDADIEILLDRALIDERGLAGAFQLTDTARSDLLRFSGGDARRALTYLEDLCLSPDSIDWRAKMQQFMDAETKTPFRKERLAGNFNRSFHDYERSYRVCTPNAQAIISRFLAEGGKLAHEVVNRYSAS